MTRPRRPRTRAAEPDVIAAIRADEPIDYAPDRWTVLVGAYYFREIDLSTEEEARAPEPEEAA